MAAVDAFDEKTIIAPVYEYTDGRFIWRSLLTYYFDKYNVELPPEFISAVAG